MAKKKKGKKRMIGSTKQATERKIKDTQKGSKYEWFKLPDDMEKWTPPVPKDKKTIRVKLDILPFEIKAKNLKNYDRGMPTGELSVEVHMGVGPEERPFVCPLKNFGLPCPICEDIARMKKKGYDEDDWKPLETKSRQLFLVNDKGELKIFHSSFHTFGKQLYTEIESVLQETGEDYLGFADLKNGATLLARFLKKTFNGQPFMELDRVDFKKRKTVKQDIIDQIIPLDTLLIVEPYDELAEIYYQGAGAPKDDPDDEDIDDEDIDDEDIDDEDDSEDIDDDDDDDDDDEDIDDDDDDDDDPDDEEEEDDPPPKKKKKVNKKKKSKKLTCPIGETFGEDFDEYEECDDCKIREECAEKAGVSIDDDDDDDPEDIEDDDDDDDDEVGENECPYGYEFGVDTDKEDECDSCDSWEDCNDARKARLKDKRKKKTSKKSSKKSEKKSSGKKKKVIKKKKK